MSTGYYILYRSLDEQKQFNDFLVFTIIVVLASIAYYWVIDKINKNKPQ